MTWKNPPSPAKKKLKTVQSPGKVMATVFWDVYEVLLVGLTPISSTINTAVYQETLKETQGGYLAKETRMLTKAVILLHDNARPQCCLSCESLDLLGLGNSFTSTTQS
jgi:hypothetical protein